MNLNYLEGKKLCVVFVKVLDSSLGKVQCRALRGRASINQGHLDVMTAKGAIFTVPSSAYPTVAPNDGTKLLGDADYFCLVKVDPNIDIEHGGDGHHHEHGDGCSCGHHHEHGDGCSCGRHHDDDDIFPVIY